MSDTIFNSISYGVHEKGKESIVVTGGGKYGEVSQSIVHAHFIIVILKNVLFSTTAAK